MKAAAFLSIFWLFTLQMACGQGAWVETEVIQTTEQGKLYGTLTEPKRCKECPLVVLIPGSGPTDRNGNSAMGLKTDTHKMLAHELAENNIASLRFDKRGVGKSTAALIREDDLRFEKNIDDVAGWIEVVTAEKMYGKIVIAGHSEGSLIGILVAQEINVEGFISLAGPGRPAAQLLKEQLTGRLSEAELSTAFGLLDSLQEGHLVKQQNKKLGELFRPSILGYLISWFQYDPAAEIQKLDIPILILQGQMDVQIQEKDARLLHAASPESQLKVIYNLDHILKPTGPKDRASEVENYINPAIPLHREVIPTMVNFINGL